MADRGINGRKTWRVHMEFRQSEGSVRADRQRGRESDCAGCDGMKKATEQPEGGGGGETVSGLSLRSGFG